MTMSGDACFYDDPWNMLQKVTVLESANFTKAAAKTLPANLGPQRGLRHLLQDQQVDLSANQLALLRQEGLDRLWAQKLIPEAP